MADALKGQVPLGFVVLNGGRAARRTAELEAELVALVRERIGPVAALQAGAGGARLPKTRSGKVLRGTLRRIADGEAYGVPPTIDDPAVLGKIAEALRVRGFGAGSRLVRRSAREGDLRPMA